MSNPVIEVENLSKRYWVGHQAASAARYIALRDVIAHGVGNLARRTCDMIKGRGSVGGDEIEEFWALKDISLAIGEGERVGIIGRNGAGKSTLLKILSRITEPTKGRVRIVGRVASLLEVGTGFHPELTGRENIFLNGAILGMTRREIQQKFDEIVAFANIEKFVDTPVKRYSSGMYVRLAFAVAAHLEPEILIIDEVLAVGDADFQKKCLGKMEDIGSEGKTILFVSHNLAMISSLCHKAVQLENGVLRAMGPTDDVILRYAASGENSPAAFNHRDCGRYVGDEHAQLMSAAVWDDQEKRVSEVEINRSFSVRMEYRILRDSNLVFIPNFHFYRQDGGCAFVTNSPKGTMDGVGEYSAECHIPADFLNDGLYSVRLVLTSYETGTLVHFDEKGALLFNVRDPVDGIVTRAGYRGAMPGAVRPLLDWSLSRID